jgi:hypothetical protein
MIFDPSSADAVAVPPGAAIGWPFKALTKNQSPLRKSRRHLE